MSSGDTQKNGPPKEQWGSKLGVILAVAGSAVGLGNFLRFPGQAAKYGGGAYMIPYFCALLIVGIPICWAEWTMGRRGGRFGFNSSPGIFSVLWRRPLSKYFGALGLIVPVVIYMYYVYVESWCLAYAYNYAAGNLDLGRNPAVYNEYFTNISGQNADGYVFQRPTGLREDDHLGRFLAEKIGVRETVFFFFLTFIANFYFIYRGLSKGIEFFCKWAIPMLLVAAVIVAGRVLTLPEQPSPAPWQISLAQALPPQAWNEVRTSATAENASTNAVARAVKDAIAIYFNALRDRDAASKGFHVEVPVIPPAGFAASPEGIAIAMMELRSPATAEPLHAWMTKARNDLSMSQKIHLQRLEQHESSAQSVLANKHAADAKKSKATAEIESIRREREKMLSSLATGPMPMLAPDPTIVVGDTGKWTISPADSQRRVIAIQLAELPRTVWNGLGYMWNPDFSQLTNPEIWVQAAGQIFFSLSVGFGVILTYASYLKRNDDVVLSSLTATATNEFCEVILGGLVAIPATFLFLGTTMTLNVIQSGSTFSLGFTTLPTVFAGMPGGRWIGAMWFFLLFLAAITSSLSMLQPAIAFLEEGFNLKRRESVAALGLMTISGALAVMYFSKGATALDTMDFWVGSVGIYVLATIEVILFGWVIGIDEGFEEAHRGADLKIPWIFRPILKFVTPTYLLVIFVAWIWANLPERLEAIRDQEVVMLTVLYLIIVFVFILLMISLAGDNWTRQGRGDRDILKEVEK